MTDWGNWNNFGGSGAPAFDGSQLGAYTFDPLAPQSASNFGDMNGSFSGSDVAPGTFNGSGGGGVFGTGMNGFQLGGDILGGLKTLGGLYLGIRQLGLANKQFKFSKAYANANLANQTQSYNTALTDRANSRAAMEGLTPAQAQSYISSNSLKPVNLGS